MRLSDEAAEGLGRLADDLSPGQLEARVSDLATGGTAEEILGIVGRSDVEQWSDESVRGLANVVSHNGAEFAEGALRRISSEYPDDVAESTLRILTDQTSAWSDAAVDGLAKIVNRVDPNTAEAILSKHGGTTSGRFVFEWLDEIGDVSSPRFDEFAQNLARSDSNYVGAIFELRYGADELGADSIRTMQDVPDGRLGMDFITRDDVFVEVKNWSDYSGGKRLQMLEQFRGNLGIDEAGDIVGPGRYGNQAYEFVFRGPRNNGVIDDLCEIARQARSAGRLSSLAFSRFRVRFLDWPSVLPDSAGNLPGSGGQSYVEVACGG